MSIKVLKQGKGVLVMLHASLLCAFLQKLMQGHPRASAPGWEEGGRRKENSEGCRVYGAKMDHRSLVIRTLRRLARFPSALPPAISLSSSPGKPHILAWELPELPKHCPQLLLEVLVRLDPSLSSHKGQGGGEVVLISLHEIGDHGRGRP